MQLTPAIALGDSQSAIAQSFYELPDAHRFRPGCHHLLVPGLGYVVVIEIETSTREAHPTGEVVQLRQRAVTHQVRPEHPMRWPPRLVDQYQVIHPESIRLRNLAARRPSAAPTQTRISTARKIGLLSTTAPNPIEMSPPGG